MTIQYINGNPAFDVVRKLQTGPSDYQPNTRQTYEQERSEAHARVLGSPFLRKMARARSTIQTALAKERETLDAIRANRDFNDDAKRRHGDAAKEATWQYLDEAVVGEFLENEKRLRMQHAALPAGLTTNPADLARVQAFGAILPHLTPRAFMDMMQASIANRDRAMLGVMVPVAESLTEYKAPFKAVAGEMVDLIHTGKLAVQSPETHAAEHAAELAEGLRRDLTYLVGTLKEHGAIDALHYEACNRFNEVETAVSEE